MFIVLDKKCVRVRLCARTLTGGAVSGISGVPGTVQVVDSPLLKQQMDVQRLAIKHLKNENYRLKVNIT